MKPRECGSDPQVDFLSDLNSIREILVWRSQIVRRSLDVLLCQSREVGTMNLDAGPALTTHIDDIEADGLTFSITICPDDEMVDVSAVDLKIFNHFLRVLDRFFLQFNFIERLHIGRLPILAVLWVFETHDVSEDRGDSQLALFTANVVIEFKDGVVF